MTAPASAAPSAVAPPARVTLGLSDAPLREALAALARPRHKPVFVDPATLGRAACARVDAEGTPEARELTSFLDARLRPLGLALREGPHAIALEPAEPAPPPVAFDRERCELLPFAVGEPLPAEGPEPAAFEAIARSVAPAPPPAGEPSRAVEQRTIASEGRRLLCEHASEVLATARIVPELAPTGVGAQLPAPASSGGAPQPTEAGERWTLRLFFVDGYRDRGPLHALGLRDADRVLSVGRQSAASATTALVALDRLCAEGPARAVVEVERKGQTLELRYDAP